MTLLLPLALLACGGDAKNEGTDTAGSDEETNPVVPESYEDRWDTESLGCEDVTVYWAFEGAIEDDGVLRGEETWYWFFATDGWDDDCADVFQVEAVEEPTPIENDACLSCDRDFTATYTLDEEGSGCSISDYEDLLDDDTKDRIDDQVYTLALMFDTNPLDAEPGGMNVWSYVQDDQSETAWIERHLSLGTLDEAAATSGPGVASWSVQDGFCVTIKESDE